MQSRNQLELLYEVVIRSNQWMVVTLDSIDMMVLKEMLTNCRASYRALSRKTGLSPNAVKNRVTRLIEAGVLADFTVKLSIETADAEFFLAIIRTDGTERFENFVAHIGNNPMICHVSALVSLSGGAYLVAGEYPDTATLAELGTFLRGSEEVQEVELHTMLTTDLERGRKMDFSRVQMKVLRCLSQNPRMQISKIADITGLAAKTVRRALREIVDGGGVNFTARFDLAAGGFLDVFVRINWDEKMISVDELIQWLEKEYPVEFWAPWSSISAPVIFGDFVVGNLPDAEQISNQIREAPFVISTTLLVNLTAWKFPFFTELRLKEMIDAAGI